MRMICRECKRIMSVMELSAHAFGHFMRLLIVQGLAAYFAQAIKDYFSDPKRGYDDDAMAGSCNGLQIPCPQCQKVAWDPLPWPEKPRVSKKKQQVTAKPQQPNEIKDNETITVTAAKQDASVDTTTPTVIPEKIEESPTP